MKVSSQRARGDLLVVLAAFIWGVAFYFQKTAMWHVGPLLFIGLRGAVAATVLLPFAILEQRRQAHHRASVLPIALLAGVVFFVAGAIQQFGIVSTSVTNTGFLTALYVVATPFAYWLIKRQRPSSTIWYSVALALAGIWALTGATLEALSQGDLLVALAALIWGLHFVVAGEAAQFNQPITFTCCSFLVVTALGLSSALLFETVSTDAIANAATAIAYVGVLSSALTFGMMAMALRHISAPRASVLLSVETVFSAGTGYLLLNERLTLVSWLGAALILSAILLLRLTDRASD